MIDGTDELVDDVSVHHAYPIPDDVMEISTTVQEQTDHVIVGGVLAEPVRCDAGEVVRGEWHYILMALTHI